MNKVWKRFVSLMVLLTVLAGGTVASAELYGGRDATVYRELYASEITTLNHYSVGNTYEQSVMADCVDGLVDYDRYGAEVPCLAVSWSSNDDCTVWTFNIRQGVKWYDFQGNEVAEVTAQDWVDAAKYVNEAVNDSAWQYMYEEGHVLNAQTYYEQTADALDAENAVLEGEFATVEEYYAENDIDPSTWISFDDVGVKALDTYTLEYTLDAPCSYFVSVLSYASFIPLYGPFVEEMGDYFGIDNETILYNGPYIMTTFEPQVGRIMEVNENYWDRDSVYITRLEYIYNAQEVTLSPTMFQSGEVDFAIIGSDILDEWMNNEATKALVRPSMIGIDYSYFYAFNFDPQFDEAFEPDNWLIAVNNENFRKSLMYGLNSLKALSVTDPYNPEALANYTITPRGFAAVDGVDYVDLAPLAPFSAGDRFNESVAQGYRDAAIAELLAAGATLPIKAYMSYNPATSNWDKECEVVKQQLEATLGADYIEVIIEAGPSTGFLGAIRRSGKYGFMKCNWGADFSDPSTFAQPFSSRNNYNFMYKSEDEGTKALMAEYYALMDVASAINTDVAARYAAYAAAEAFLLEHAIIIPYTISSDGYVADMLNPFDRQYTPFGLSQHRMKGRQMLAAPMDSAAYFAALETWQAERAAALAE